MLQEKKQVHNKLHQTQNSSARHQNCLHHLSAVTFLLLELENTCLCDDSTTMYKEDITAETNQTKVQAQSFWFAFLTDRRMTSPTPRLYLQGEGELQVGLRQPRRGQQDLVGAQDPLGALRRRREERHKKERTS